MSGSDSGIQPGQALCCSFSRMGDPYLDKTLDETVTNPNMTDNQINVVLKKLVVYAIDQAPAIILLQLYFYVAWWPWVKNYYGERCDGQQRSGPIHGPG